MSSRFARKYIKEKQRPNNTSVTIFDRKWDSENVRTMKVFF